MYKILVVEDDHVVRQMLVKTLTTEGYECLASANVHDGLAACARSKPDLALLDVHLPDGNGIELCRKLRAEPKLRHIPILILTGEASSVDNRIEGLEAGAEDYVLKPFDPPELLARIKGILSASLPPRRRTERE